MADQRAAGRAAGPDRGGDLRPLAGRPARRPGRGGHRRPGVRRPGELFVDTSRDARRRDRGRDAAGRERGDPGAAAAGLRGEPDRHLPRSRSGAVPPLPGHLPLDRARVRCARGGARRQARQPGVAARQDARHVGVLRDRCGDRLVAPDLSLPGQRSRRGHPGQATGPRDDHRPPGAADGPGRELRRHRPAGAAARRVRQRRR